MSDDISTMYAKEQNQKTGRKGYVGWQSEKEISISPADYGAFLFLKKSNKKRRIYR